jgi:4'-phosphopantetheinyl transferase
VRLAAVTVELWRVPEAVDGEWFRSRVATDAPCTSVTHTNGCSLFAAAPVRVGVDTERVRPRRYRERLAVRSMTEPELRVWRASADPDRALLAHWTRVEAYLKAIGVGVRGGLRTRAPDEGWTVVALDLGTEHVGALAVEAERPIALRTHLIASPHDLRSDGA